MMLFLVSKVPWRRRAAGFVEINGPHNGCSPIFPESKYGAGRRRLSTARVIGMTPYDTLGIVLEIQ